MNLCLFGAKHISLHCIFQFYIGLNLGGELSLGSLRQPRHECFHSVVTAFWITVLQHYGLRERRQELGLENCVLWRGNAPVCMLSHRTVTWKTRLLFTLCRWDNCSLKENPRILVLASIDNTCMDENMYVTVFDAKALLPNVISFETWFADPKQQLVPGCSFCWLETATMRKTNRNYKLRLEDVELKTKQTNKTTFAAWWWPSYSLSFNDCLSIYCLALRISFNCMSLTFLICKIETSILLWPVGCMKPIYTIRKVPNVFLGPE